MTLHREEIGSGVVLHAHDHHAVADLHRPGGAGELLTDHIVPRLQHPRIGEPFGEVIFLQHPLEQIRHGFAPAFARFFQWHSPRAAALRHAIPATNKALCLDSSAPA